MLSSRSSILFKSDSDFIKIGFAFWLICERVRGLVCGLVEGLLESFLSSE